MVEIMLEPIGERIGLLLDTSADVGDTDEFDLRDLGRMRLWARAERREIDVNEFVFLHAVVEVGAVACEKSQGQRVVDSEFLAEPPAGRRNGIFPRARF